MQPCFNSAKFGGIPPFTNSIIWSDNYLPQLGGGRREQAGVGKSREQEQRVLEFQRKGESILGGLEKAEAGVGRNPRHGQRKVPKRLKLKNKISNVSNYFQDVISHRQRVVMGRKRRYSIKGNKECNEERNKRSNLHLFGGTIFRGAFVNQQVWAVHIRVLRGWWKSPEMFRGSSLDGHRTFLQPHNLSTK